MVWWRAGQGRSHARHSSWIFNPLCAEFYFGNIQKNRHVIFIVSCKGDRQATAILLHEREVFQFILHRQYQGWWWSGNARSQDINSHCVDLVLPICSWEDNPWKSCKMSQDFVDHLSKMTSELWNTVQNYWFEKNCVLICSPNCLAPLGERPFSETVMLNFRAHTCLHMALGSKISSYIWKH